MKYFFPFFYVAFFAACNNEGTTTVSNDTVGTATTASTQTDTVAAANLPACYAYQTSNDLVSLKLNALEPTVSGNLTYAFMGKDKNEGTITGTMRGDTLLADYTFQSEGAQSVRQVAFLKKGDSFVEGYGDSKQEGDKMVFTNTGALNFGSTMILKKIPCNP